MIFTSKYISLTAPTSGGEKKGFLALGEGAQKKLCAVAYSPSLAREGALFLPNLPPPMHRLEFPLSFHGTAYGATIRVSRHCTTGDFQTPQRSPAWATSASGSIRAVRPQSRNLLKPYRKAYYGPNGQQCTRKKSPR